MRTLVAIAVIAAFAVLLVTAHGKGLPLQRAPEAAAGLHGLMGSTVMDTPPLRTRAPSTVVGYAAVVGIVLALLLVRSGLDRVWLYGAPILLLSTCGLALRLWWAWLFLTVVAGGDIVL